jgi:hypothetical protein
MKTLNILLPVIFASQVHAQCLIKDTVRINTQVAGLGACQSEQPEFKNTNMWYQNFSANPYLVQYWSGGYSRTVTLRETYMTQVTNWCTGKTGLQQTTSKFSRVQKSFALENPNLNPALEHSYEMSPMAESELPAAMKQAAHECQAYGRQDAESEFNSPSALQ